MKRELAFALEAQSQFSCFLGRTRSSKTQSIEFTNTDEKTKERSSVDHSKNSIHEVRITRRSKRFKVGNPDVDSVNVDESKGKEDSAAVEVAKGEGLKENLIVKRKNRVNDNVARRLTRSAVKEKGENVEELATPTRKKLELKMSKKIGLAKMPTNMRELLDTGLLEGYRVFYNYGNKEMNLQGIIKGIGILCSCSLCRGSKVISPSQFELHACNSYRHAIKHICLENGKSLLEVMEICKTSALESLEVAVQTVISSLPVKGLSRCTNCMGSFEPSSIANALFCDSCVNSEQVEAGLKVATRVKLRGQTSPRSPTECELLHEKSEEKMAMRSSRSVPKPPENAADCNLSRKKIKKKILKRSSKTASVPRPTKSATRCGSSQKINRSKLTIKNQQLHWLVFDEGGLPDGTELTYLSHGTKLLGGYKQGRGIFCFCCNTEVSASQFEAHAGWASRKKPYENIYMSNGVSLHEYAVALKKNRRCLLKDNDDLCRVCGDGGNLLLCDGCPRSFHQECASEPSIPHGKWYCKYCECSLKFDAENANAVAAGRVTGIDPIEQITKRCIRIVNNPENNDLVACVLCRSSDFSKQDFNDQTVIVCDQCEKEYHIGCLRAQNMDDLKALPKGKWFCCMDCKRIHSVLKNSLTHGPKKLPDALMAIFREKQKDNGSDSIANLDMKWMLLSGKNASAETRPLLIQAVEIFHDCFDPIIDATSGRDFIPSMVYGRKIWGQDFAGMLCAILIVNSKIVTAGVLRVFGQDIAELPIVATSKSNQGKGYFQLLFTCIERLLSSLNIKKIVLPAAEEAKSIWTNKFGFETIPPQQLSDLRQTCSAMMTFKGTSMLQKEVPLDGISNLSVE